MTDEHRARHLPEPQMQTIPEGKRKEHHQTRKKQSRPPALQVPPLRRRLHRDQAHTPLPQTPLRTRDHRDMQATGREKRNPIHRTHHRPPPNTPSADS